MKTLTNDACSLHLWPGVTLLLFSRPNEGITEREEEEGDGKLEHTNHYLNHQIRCLSSYMMSVIFLRVRKSLLGHYEY